MMRHRQFLVKWFVAALAASVIVGPFVGWAITGSLGMFGVIYAAQAALGILGRYLSRSLGLPGWSASESYVSRLRRWQADRGGPSSDPPASCPS